MVAKNEVMLFYFWLGTKVPFLQSSCPNLSKFHLILISYPPLLQLCFVFTLFCLFCFHFDLRLWFTLRNGKNE